MKRVCVIGLGYVGLPLLCAISKSNKYETCGYDISSVLVKKLKQKECPIEDMQCSKDLKEIELEVSSNPRILKDSDYFIICVPTPVSKNYVPNYGPVESAAKAASKYLKKGGTVILESTVNPGTCEEVVMPIIEEISGLEGGKDFTLAHCPERINPGDPKWNVYNIPRNIGSFPKKNVKKVADFYRNFLEDDVNEVSSLKVAEATKIVENTFRDINIAYVNELAMSFDTLGIDLIETLKGAANKPFAFLAHWPGRGVGGHCIAVDPYYLINRAAKSGFTHSFLKIARDVNNNMPKYTVKRLQLALNEVKLPINGTKIALLGLSYKENVGDLRESPCLKIRNLLKKLGADLKIFDPYLPKLSNVNSLEDALKEAEAIMLCTVHKEFMIINKILSKYKNIKVVIDGMNKLDKDNVEKLGIVYKGIGR